MACRQLVVHKWIIRRGSCAQYDAIAPTDLGCHLRPAFFCPCERTVSSAWLQPLCGMAITGGARPTLAGRGTRRLNAECLCVPSEEAAALSFPRACAY